MPVLLQKNWHLKPKEETILPYRMQKMATLDKKASQMAASFKVADEDPSYASP